MRVPSTCLCRLMMYYEGAQGDGVKMKAGAHALISCSSLRLLDDFEGVKMSSISQRESFNYKIYQNPPIAV